MIHCTCNRDCLSSSSAAKSLIVATANEESMCQEACIRGIEGQRSSNAKQPRPTSVAVACSR